MLHPLWVSLHINEIPLSLLFSRLSRPSSLSLSSQQRCSSHFSIFVALCWTPSSMPRSLSSWRAELDPGLQMWPHPALSRGEVSLSLHLLPKFCSMKPRIPQAFYVTRARCWPTFSMVPPRPISAELLPAGCPQHTLVLGQFLPRGTAPPPLPDGLHKVPANPCLSLLTSLWGIIWVSPAGWLRVPITHIMMKYVEQDGIQWSLRYFPASSPFFANPTLSLFLLLLTGTLMQNSKQKRKLKAAWDAGCIFLPCVGQKDYQANRDQSKVQREEHTLKRQNFRYSSAKYHLCPAPNSRKKMELGEKDENCSVGKFSHNLSFIFSIIYLFHYVSMHLNT